jgi:Zn-finger nucleic acid-binding protein
MIVVEYHQIELDYCTNCSGVWFDAGELELLCEAANLAGAGLSQDSLARLPEARASEKKRKCPICRRKMKKVVIGKNPEILIDACPDEEGLWFDGGELDQLVQQLSPKASASGECIASFLKDVFQTPR